MKYILLCLICCFYFTSAYAQKTIRYDLFVKDTLVNYTGTARPAISINGSIPAPTLSFTEGDTADIYVHNALNTETSIHWHGLILPNEQDGVPYLTTAPIKAGTIHHFHFPIVQHGTYWYHSHTQLQEQVGMYGGLIIHKRGETPMPEYVLVLSDWTNQKPYEVHRSLHNANDWYAIQKGSTQSYSEAVSQGYFKQRLKSDWLRMTPMDVSDVYYDRFLINGKPDITAPKFKPGTKVKLRIVNGGASSYFWLQYGGGKLTVVANDGSEVVPVDVDRMIIAVAETYDVVVTIPADGIAYEFVATPEDRTKQASLWLGPGMKKLSSPMPKLKYFEGLKMMNGMMNVDGSMDNMGMQMSLQQMDMNTVMYPEISGEVKMKKAKMGSGEMQEMKGVKMNHSTRADLVTLNYAMLRSPEKTTLPNAPTRTLNFKLTGNMLRYLWTLDNKTVSESDQILIRKGENIRIILENASMMRHPMHLHGHFFRVLNGQGKYSPLKNVLDIMPMETDTIEFNASEEYGDWFFHCHILYHMMSGMGRVFRYENSPPNPQLPNAGKAQRKLFADDRQWHPMARIGLESNGSDGEAMISNKRNFVQTEWRLGLNKQMGYESESHIGRYLDKHQFFRAYLGWDYRYRVNPLNNPNGGDNAFGTKNTKNDRQVICAGLIYLLPMHVSADLRVDHTGLVRLQLVREDIPISPRIRMDLMVNSDLEFRVAARYLFTKYFAVSTHYDSDMRFGAGVTLSY